MADTQVLIVGAGPVGLTLAVDLGKRGIRCVLLETKEAPAFLPKMERCNARTMELYRRMGIVGRVRAAGLPPDVPMDVFIVFSLVEPPLLQLPYPSVAQAQAEIAATADASQPLEPYQLISQYTLEPLLKSIAEELPAVAVRYGHELTAFTDNGNSVTAHVRRSDGTTADISADYLVGCDGGTSAVRKQLGIKLQGDGNIGQFRQALYRCDDLFERIPIGKGRHYHVADAQSSFLITQDSTKHFTLHATVDSDDEMKTMFEKVVAMPVAYEMLSCAPWKQNLPREKLIAMADVEQRKSNEMIGAELGYRYAGSPLIWPEPGEAPEHDFMTYRPSTWPGARLPHVWLADRTAVQDRIGYGDHYTLLRLRARADTSGLEAAMRSTGAPFRVLDLDDAHARDIYGHDLMLLRPDMHVVWRGNVPPDDTARLARMAMGH